MDFSHLKGSVFYDLLLFDIPGIGILAKDIVQSGKTFLGAVFMVGAIWEFFTTGRYTELVLRTVLCLLVFASHEPFLKKSIGASFALSEQFLKKNSPQNRLIVGLKKATEITKKEIKEKARRHGKDRPAWWDRLLVMAKVAWSDAITVVIWLLVYCVFLMLKILYTTMFHLLYVFLPVQALLCLFPPTQSSLQGAFRTYLRLVMTPPVIAVILVIFDGSMDYVTDIANYTVSENLRGLVQLLMSGILLLLSPVFASAILDGRGTTAVGSKVAHIAALGAMTAGFGAVFKWTTRKLPKRAAVTILRKLGVPVGGKKFAGKKTKKRRPEAPSPKETKRNKAALAKLKEKAVPFEPQETKTKDDKPKTPLLAGTFASLWERNKVKRKAKKLIKRSREGGIDIRDFSPKEKQKALEMAHSNPKKNFIRRNVYFALLKDLSSRDEENGSETGRKNSKAKRSRRPKARRAETQKNKPKPAKEKRP